MGRGLELGLLRQWLDSAQTGRCDLAFAIDTDHFAVFNTIVQKSSATPSIFCAGAPHGSGSGQCATSNYNLFRPNSSDSENLSDTNCGSGGKTFANPPGFIGATSKVGIAFNINFVALDPTTYANSDFHIMSGSEAIDAGTCMFRAGNAGSRTTIGSLTATGGSSDPRLYFIEPASYKGAAGDTINIGNSRVTITSLTSSSISFKPSVSWSAGACVHLAYSGSAPDMGVFELGATAPPPVRSRRLNSSRWTQCRGHGAQRTRAMPLWDGASFRQASSLPCTVAVPAPARVD